MLDMSGPGIGYAQRTLLELCDLAGYVWQKGLSRYEEELNEHVRSRSRICLTMLIGT
jgi:hypothetical protein